jgi:predicted ester cyclase
LAQRALFAKVVTMIVRTSSTESGQQNLARLGQYSARVSAGDYSAIYEHFAPEFASHATERITPAAVGTDIRPQEQKFWEMAHAAFPDMQFRVDVLIEANDLVVSNWTMTGTHTGAHYYDVPPSGEPVIINGTAILRIRDGQVVEHWGGPHCMYGIGLVRKIGAGPHAAEDER